MRDLVTMALAAGLVGTLVGVGLALWLGRQQRRTYQQLLVRDHQRNLVLEVLQALRVLEARAVDGSSHPTVRREQQAQLRRVEDQLLLTPISPGLVTRARVALEVAERTAGLGARAPQEVHAELARERAARREDFVSAARRELRLRSPRRGSTPVEPADEPTYAPRRALG